MNGNGNFECHGMVQIMSSIQCENPASAWGHNQKGANDHPCIINMTMVLSAIFSVGGHSNRGDFHINSVKSTAS